MAIAVKVNDRKVLLDLSAMARRMRPRSMLPIAGEVMRGSIKETFEQEGYPAGSWRRVHGGTLAEQFTRGGRNKRKTAKKRGGDTAGFRRFTRGKKILTDSGRLQRSITYRTRGRRLVIGTSLIYAAIHQTGGVIRAKGKALRIPIGGGRAIFRKSVTIPARPFLVIKPQDPADIAGALDARISDRVFHQALRRAEPVAQLRLATKLDPTAVRLPARAYSQLCAWKFKGPECGFVGAPTVCNKTFADCTTFAREHRFSGFIQITRAVEEIVTPPPPPPEPDPFEKFFNWHDPELEI